MPETTGHGMDVISDAGNMQRMLEHCLLIFRHGRYAYKREQKVLNLSTHPLSSLKSQPVPIPPLIPSRHQEPQTADPAQHNADPRLRRPLE
jgi:hypothetical protein